MRKPASKGGAPEHPAASPGAGLLSVEPTPGTWADLTLATWDEVAEATWAELAGAAEEA